MESVAENLIKVTRKMMKTKNPPGDITKYGWALAINIEKKALRYKGTLEKLNGGKDRRERGLVDKKGKKCVKKQKSFLKS